MSSNKASDAAREPQRGERKSRQLGEVMLTQMVKIRSLERELTRMSQSGRLRGSLHLASGQEACPAGACSALRKDDAFTVTYRGHGYAICKGVDFDAIVAEILGKESGLCHGRGGKMHLMDLEFGLLGANGIVGGGVGTAAGAALASKMDGSGRVAMTVFGDGTLNQGHTMEVLNMAGLWKLPIIFLCENNLYAEMTPLERSTAVTELTKKMGAFGIDAVRIDGNDAFAVHEAVAAAADKARKGGGPTFIEAMTYRVVGHYQNDPGTGYRTQAEIKSWQAKDPIALLARELKLSDKELSAIEERQEEIVKAAIDRAVAAADPAPANLDQEVFA